MKINIQKILRVTLPIISVLSLVFVSAMPACAYGVDYNDYVTDVEIDGENDVITATFPVTDSYYLVQQEYNEILRGNGSSFSFYVSPNQRYSIYWQVFGNGYADPNNGLDLSLLPDGTLIKFEYKFSTGMEDAVQRLPAYYLRYFDSENNLISQDVYQYEQPEGDDIYSCYFNIKKPEGAVICSPVFTNELTSTSNSYTANYEFIRVTLKFSISSLIRQQQLTGKTNKLLDDIINGSKEDQEAADQFGNVSGDQADKMDGMNDAMDSVNKPEAGDINMDISDYFTGGDVAQYLPFMAVLVGSPHIVSMMVVLLTVSVIAYVLFGKRS